MITILTSFKPFSGLHAIHQINALASWRALWPDAEILAFGAEDPGCPEQWQVQFVPDIPSFEPGRYHRIDRIFSYAEAHGSFDAQMYINGDIILFDDFRAALDGLQMNKFLLIGQRMDVDFDDAIDFSNPDARRNCRDLLLQRGVLHGAWGIDYFAYRRGSIPQLPPLYLGAARWDNLTIYHCRRAGVPVVDATGEICVFHQNHSYRLMENGQRYSYHGAVVDANEAQCRRREHLFLTSDASHVMKKGRVRTSLLSLHHIGRMIYTFPILRDWPPVALAPFLLGAAIWRRVRACYVVLTAAGVGKA